MKKQIETELILADGGVIMPADISRLLRLEGVLVHRVRFTEGEPHEVCSVPWAGHGIRDEEVHGTITLRVDPGKRHLVVEAMIRTEAEVTMRPPRPTDLLEPRGLYPREAQGIELLARDALRQAMEQPGCASALAAHLARIVDIVEGGVVDEEG